MNAKKVAELFQALAEGKSVEFTDDDRNWYDVADVASREPVEPYECLAQCLIDGSRLRITQTLPDGWWCRVCTSIHLEPGICCELVRLHVQLKVVPE